MSPAEKAAREEMAERGKTKGKTIAMCGGGMYK